MIQIKTEIDEARLTQQIEDIIQFEAYAISECCTHSASIEDADYAAKKVVQLIKSELGGENADA